MRQQSGVQGLIATFRALFDTFGVPMEISSNGGPEFWSAADADFLTRREVRHHMSSAYFLQSNGRAQVAVKKANRMLMDNVGPTWSLNNDGHLHETLQACKTPDPDCNISPAQVFLAEVRPTTSDYSPLSYGLATRAVVPPTSSKSPQLTTSLPQLARTTAERRVINTDQTTASAIDR